MISKPTQKACIVWDLDDTLNDLTRGWLAWALERCPKKQWPCYNELSENPPHRICGLSIEAYLESLDEYRVSESANKLSPIPTILEWFQANGDAFDHHIVTARSRSTVPHAAFWTFKHFGRWVRHFHFVPAARSSEEAPDQGASKRSVIEQIGRVDYFIDDSARNLEECANIVGTVLLMPQPWNRSTKALPVLLSSLQYQG